MAECSGGLDGVLDENSNQTTEDDSRSETASMETEGEQEEELFEVEKIVGSTKVDGKTLYKVRWRGYKSCWDTFEPVENLESCLDLIEDFNDEREAMKQKRADERRKRKALMEGRPVPDKVQNLDDCDAMPSISPAAAATPALTPAGDPDTLKDTFWRDLEQGKVNLFETDMYSKVKGRASRPTSSKSGRKGTRHSERSRSKGEEKKKHRRSRSKGKRSDTTGDQQQKAEKVSRRSKTEPQKSNVLKTSINRRAAEYTSDTRQFSESDQNDSDTRDSVSSKSSSVRSSNSSRSISSNSRFDPTTGERIQSPVSMTSELLVKVARVHVEDGQISPALTPGATPPPSSDQSQTLFSITERENGSNRKKTAAVPKAELHGSIAREESPVEADVNLEPSEPLQIDYSNMWACPEKKEIPKRSVSVEETVVVKKKKKKHSEAEKSSSSKSNGEEDDKLDQRRKPSQAMDCRVDKPATTYSSTESGIARCVKGQQDNLYGVTNFTTGATHLSINTNINITSHVDVTCTQSAITGSSELESSSRGDKFAETSPLVEATEIVRPRTAIADAKEVEPEIELDDLDPEEYDREVEERRANPEVLELNESQFQEAVLNGDFEKVKNALNSQRSFNLESIDSLGKTLLMFAGQKGYDDIAELLVSQGARINAQQRTGMTTLMLACEQGHFCTVVLLVEMGANINLQQTSGETALMKAVKKGNKQIVRFLLERGANFASQTITGNSAMTYAKMLHVCDVEDMLFDHVARLTAEFDRQVSVTINNTAKIMCALFPLQCFPLCDGDRFVIHFKHELQPITPGVGYLLFVAHTRITPQEIKCRFYGPCAVSTVLLNGVVQPSLTEEANFVLSCCPLNNGKNELVINTTTSPSSKSKLVVCAYKAKLME